MGRHSAPVEMEQEQPAWPTQRVAANTALFGRKKEIKRLDAENEALHSQLLVQSQRIHELESLVGRLNGMTLMQRENALNELNRKIADQQQQLESAIASESDNIKKAIADESEQLKKLSCERTTADQELKSVKDRIIILRDEEDLQEQGLFDYINPAENSVELQAKLAENRKRQKDLIRNGLAVNAIRDFMFNNSAAKGKKFVNDMCKMALSLYNTEAENCVKSVKAGNLTASIKRLERCEDKIARFGKFISLRITFDYRKLRWDELQLTAQYLEAVRREKEEERERRAAMREEAKAAKELQAEMARLNKEHEHYANVLERMRERGDTEEVEKLEAKLSDLDRALADVDYRSANIRAGYVYVISDIGAFGERMVKIGMTRRLDPMDRVRELSDASVPFRFDVHALFFSKDAVSLETMLHHEFEDRRVNKVNARKEFYYCTPQEVLDKLREKDVAVVEYRVEPEAEEYRLSQQIADERASRKEPGR